MKKPSKLTTRNSHRPPASPVIRARVVLRIATITREAFQHLPALLTASVFMEWSGLNPHDFYEAVRAGEIRVWRAPGHKKARYYKADLGKICNW